MCSVKMTERLLINLPNIPDNYADRGLLFDTNVWLLIYGIHADPADRRTAAYSALYKKALQASCPIYTCQTIISEYIGVSLRLRASLTGWKPGNGNGKIHQQASYNIWTEEVADEVAAILADANCKIDNFDGSQVDTHLTQSGSENIDYCDLLIKECCTQHNLRLVTDDRDFSAQKLDIITNNRRLTSGI